MKPPISYFGSKLSVAEEIASLLPPHKHYVEPFAGSLAVLLAKRPAVIETVNDLNGRLMSFWRVLRDQAAELELQCTLTPHSRAELAAAYEQAADPLEDARRVWVILTQGRGGHMDRRGGGWRFYGDPNGTSQSFAEYLAAYLGRLAPAAARLRSVALESRSALEIIETYGQHPDVLIYADPPYPRETRTCTNTRGYEHEMLDQDGHRELAEALLGAHAAVVLSGYDCELYGKLYGSWDRCEIASHASNAAPGKRGRTEVLWSNREFPQGSLFDACEVSA